MAEQGPRGSSSYPGNQRPTNFGGGMKNIGPRVSREDVAKHMKEVHKNVPKNVKKTGKKGKSKEKMLQAIAFSKSRRGK